MQTSKGGEDSFTDSSHAAAGSDRSSDAGLEVIFPEAAQSGDFVTNPMAMLDRRLAPATAPLGELLSPVVSKLASPPAGSSPVQQQPMQGTHTRRMTRKQSNVLQTMI